MAIGQSYQRFSSRPHKFTTQHSYMKTVSFIAVEQIYICGRGILIISISFYRMGIQN